jgi:hypothetical protein
VICAHLNNSWRSQVEETDKRSQLVDIPEAECRELLAGEAGY